MKIRERIKSMNSTIKYSADVCEQISEKHMQRNLPSNMKGKAERRLLPATLETKRHPIYLLPVLPIYIYLSIYSLIES